MQLYNPDHGLPATQVLLDVSRMLPRFRRMLEFSGDLSLSISSIRYKPNTSCVVSYRICMDGVDSFGHAKAFHKDDWPNRKQKLHGLEPNVLIDDEHALALFRFPFDAEIPAIQTLEGDPQSFLKRVFFGRYGTQVPRAMLPLAYKPNRRYTVRLETETGSRFVLKLHDSSTFDQVLESAQSLKESGFGSAPKRVGRSRRHFSMMYQWIEGNEVDFSKLMPGHYESSVESIFGYLDRLHAATVPSGLATINEGAMGGVNAIASYLALIYHPCTTRVRAIADFLLDNHPGFGPRSFVHGDFHEGQMVESGGEIRACDFDNCGSGDATSDIANFVAHLRLRACQGAVSESAFDRVEDSVARQLGRKQETTLLGRYRWNQIASSFQLTTHPFRSGAGNWTGQIDWLLERLERQIRESQSKHCERIPEYSSTVTNISHTFCGQESQAEKEVQLPVRAIQDDSGLAFLSPLFDPVTSQKAIEQHAPNVREFLGEFEVLDVIARRIKPARRCLIEFVLSTETGIRSILGKVSAKRLDKKTHALQSTLFNQNGFGPDCADEIMVPQPLGQLGPWKMWLQKKVPGSSASQYMKSDRLDVIAGQIAASLAKLHNSDLHLQKKHCVSEELRILKDRLEPVATDQPGYSDRIRRILNGCHAIGQTIDELTAVPVHRDFYQDQILFAGTRTWLVDLDLVSLGHPALDVGNFLAHLTEHGIRKHGDPGRWTRESAEIIRQYAARMPNVTALEIRSFEAISLARHIFISWSRPDRKYLVGRMVAETERKLNSLMHSIDLRTRVLPQPCLEF